MIAPVDVLAVMDREAAVANAYRLESGEEILAADAAEDVRQARAAVAELIEAAEKHLLAINQMDEAMKDGINVHGALSATLGTEDMLRFAIKRARGAE